MELEIAKRRLYSEPASTMLPMIRYSQGDSDSDAGYVTPVNESATEIESSPGGCSDTAESNTSGSESQQINEDLKQKVRAQIEYYFSDENLLKDSFLLKHINRNRQGYVSLKLVASLRKIKSLTKSWEVVLEAVRSSDVIEVNPESTKICRKTPPPQIDMSHVSKTLVASNLPEEDMTVPQLEQVFGRYGGIQHVRILHPGKAVPIDVKKYKSFHPKIGKEVCAIVEYDTAEAASTAQQKLDTSDSWRQGMFVELLNKQEKQTAETDDKKKSKLTSPKRDVESRLQKTTEKPNKKGERKKYTHSPDASRKMLQPGEAKECASDSGLSRHSSPSPDQQRGRYRPALFTRAVKSECSTKIIRQPLGPDGSRGFKLQAS